MNLARQHAAPPSGVRRGRLAALGLSLALLYGCGGGCSLGGGGCAGGYVYGQSGLPNGGDAVVGGAQARLTQSALDFLEVHLKDLLVGALGEDPSYPGYVVMVLNDPFDVGGGVTIGEGPNETYPTTVLIDAQELGNKLRMELVEAGTGLEIYDEGGNVALTVDIPRDGILIDAIKIPIGLDARLFTEVDLGVTTATAGCDIDGTNPEYCPGGSECGILTDLTIAALVYPRIENGAGCDVPGLECLRIDVDVLRTELGDIGTDSLDVSVPPRCNVSNPAPDCSEECSDTVAIIDSDGDAECSIICAVEEFGLDLVLGLLDFLEPLITPFLDNALEIAVRDALADFDGAPISYSDRMAASALLPGVVSASSLDLGVTVGPTGDAFDVNCAPGTDCASARGMDFALLSGVEPAPDPLGATGIPHPCVNAIAGQDFINLYGEPQFVPSSAVSLSGEVNGEPYHLGASLAKDAVNQAMFGAYSAGTLCLEVSSDGVHQLSGGGFPLSAGTLNLLTEGRLSQFAPPSAPAIITLSPKTPPIISLGEGTEEDGHLKLLWDDVEVSFYVLTFERFGRVFAVSADISMQLSVFHDPEAGQLQISIIDGPTIDDFDERYNELLPEVSFVEVLESLLGLAFDALLSNGLSFDLNLADVVSDALGVPLYLDFQGIETLPAGDPEFLNLYLSLTDTPPGMTRLPRPHPLRVAEEPGLLSFVVDPELPGLSRPRATTTLRLEGAAEPLPPGREYFVRTDFGILRGPFAVDDDGVLTVEDPKLALVGEHRLYLRGRAPGNDEALDAEPVEVVVTVDPYRPRADLSLVGGQVVAEGTDLGSSPRALLWSWQLDDGAWSDFAPLRGRSLDDLAGARFVSVRAKDPAGNVSFPARLDLRRR